MSVYDPMRINAVLWADDAIRDLEPDPNDCTDEGIANHKVFDTLVQLRGAYTLLAERYTSLTRAVGAAAAEVFGDGMFAMQTGEHFSCYEAEVVADMMTEAGFPDQAKVWLDGHALGDDEGDSHYRGEES